MSRLLAVLLFNLCSLSIQGQFTNIPDPNFEQALIDQGLDSGAPDGEVLTSNINTITSLNVDSYSIFSLTGIEEFSSLEELYCGSNFISELDLSSNINLTYLFCIFNPLTSLNVDGLINIYELNAYGCELETLDLTDLVSLETLAVPNNQLSNIDVSNCPALNLFNCNDNLLVSLDISSNTALTRLNAYNNNLQCLNTQNGNNSNFIIFNILNNPLLECVEVDNSTYSTDNWFDIDEQVYFSFDCGIDCAICCGLGSGCTDPLACNYNSNAIEDDGSCETPPYPYDCNLNCLNDEDQNGICDEFEQAAPYNPDSNGDGIINLLDLLEIFPLFGQPIETVPCINPE